MRKRAFATAVPALALGLALAAPHAAPVIEEVDDGRGNTITFDVRVPGFDTSEYAKVLSDSVHGREIRTITVVVGLRTLIRRECGADSAACYDDARGGTLFLQATGGRNARNTALHEYGHHIDASIRTPAAPRRERTGDGSPRWFAARGIRRLLRQDRLGYEDPEWERTIAEIFAEDYAQVTQRAGYAIFWLPRPRPQILRAIRRDITGPSRRVDPGPRQAARTYTDRGRIPPARSHDLDFYAIARGSHVDFSGRFTGVGAPATVRTSLRCNGRRVTATSGSDATDSTLSRRNLGPADCVIRVENIGDVPVDYESDMTLGGRPT